jgi:hypothetical protein
MIEDGRAYAVAIVVQHLLQKLEQKKILSPSERVAMLDDVCEEIRNLVSRGGLAPNAGADASRTAGLMYLKPEQQAADAAQWAPADADDYKL